MLVFRRQRRSLSRLALFAFLCGWMLPLYEAHPLGAADDAACQLTAPDQGATRLSGPGSDENSEHCLVCHLQRGLSGASPSNVAALITPFESSPCLQLDQHDPLSASCAAPSSRGPPVFSI